MLALSTLGSASSIWVQRAYGTVSAKTLLVPCLLRGARCMFGRRGTMSWLATPVPSPVSSPPPVCSRGGGFDADGPVTSGAFFFGGMSTKTMKIWLARTPDLVHTTSTPPAWRAKDVGGNRPPRTPMGTEPLLGSARSGGCTRSRSRRHTHNDFTQLRAARMRKTLLLLVWLIQVLALERKKLQ